MLWFVYPSYGHHGYCWDLAAVATFQGDGGPGLAGVHEGGVGDLLADVLVLVEGEGAAEADVGHHAHRPHVQRAVVAAAAQHLGGQVRRRTNHRAAERLFPDDAGEAEVAQLHLGWGGGGLARSVWIAGCRGVSGVMEGGSDTNQ